MFYPNNTHKIAQKSKSQSSVVKGAAPALKPKQQSGTGVESKQQIESLPLVVGTGVESKQQIESLPLVVGTGVKSKQQIESLPLVAEAGVESTQQIEPLPLVVETEAKLEQQQSAAGTEAKSKQLVLSELLPLSSQSSLCLQNNTNIAIDDKLVSLYGTRWLNDEVK